MYEKVNIGHPDKVADRIAGAIVDVAYNLQKDPKIAVEVLIGHGKCHIITETSVKIPKRTVKSIVKRIAGNVKVDYKEVPQDPILAKNQDGKIRCGDNGIFKGTPVTKEQKELCRIAHDLYTMYNSDGKYILDKGKLTICQSNADSEYLKKKYPNAIINPLGDWTGGTDVDTGATNRKLGSDMGDSVTGGGLCLSGDSQFLSDDLMWHNMCDYKAGQKVAQWNNGNLEFVNPLKYIHNKNDEMLHIYNNTKLSMMLTPNHKMLIETSKGNLIKKDASEIAEKLERRTGNSGKVLHTFYYVNDSNNSVYEDGNDYRLQVAFCADGTLLPYKKWGGRIRVKKEYKKERLREILNGKEYVETQDKEYSIFWVKPRVHSKSLYECFKNENWDILKDEVFNWDGNENLKVFRTTSKIDADFVQFVLQSYGHCATIKMDDRVGLVRKNFTYNREYINKSILYTVSVLKSNRTNLRESKKCPIYVDRLSNQDSYCFEVPSHNLIIRHNNKIFITGNCGKDTSKADVSVNIYAWLKAQETGKTVKMSCSIGDEYVDGIPYEEIVSVAKNYINSIGGFEKFAEWGLIR